MPLLPNDYRHSEDPTGALRLDIRAPAPPAAAQTPAPAVAAPRPIGVNDQLSDEDFLRIFDQVFKVDPRLAFNLTEYGLGGQAPFQRNQMQIAQKYFGGDMQRFNAWVNMSSPQGSNAHSMTPQEQHWLSNQVRTTLGQTPVSVSSLPNHGGYNNGVRDNWTPYTLSLNDLYSGTYQTRDGSGGAYNPAQLMAGYEGIAGTGVDPNANPYLQGATGATSPRTGDKPLMTRTGGQPMPNVTAPPNPNNLQTAVGPASNGMRQAREIDNTPMPVMTAPGTFTAANPTGGKPTYKYTGPSGTWRRAQ